ncbi:MAG: hypothetical protein ABH844_02995 [Candidatus Omnitrophota bacterium]
MNNEKTFMSEFEKGGKLFKINDGLLLLIVAGGLFMNLFIFASLGYLLFKSELGLWIGGAFSLIVSGCLSNAIHNWGVGRLKKENQKVFSERG